MKQKNKISEQNIREFEQNKMDNDRKMYASSVPVKIRVQFYQSAKKTKKANLLTTILAGFSQKQLFSR